MRITDKLQKAEREGRTYWSFEYFPPRTAQGLSNLFDRIERMRGLGPEFIDITWRSRDAELTDNLVQICQESIGMECCMHLCCTEMPVEKVHWALEQARKHGCQNILALRGDPPTGSEKWKQAEGGLRTAADLVRYIHKHFPGDFCVAVAGFPQGHPESPATSEGIEQEIKYLVEKVDAGAEFIFTQMFYDTDIFFDWIKRVRAAGITVPIVPGIMPIQNWDKFCNWVEREKIIVPPQFYEKLNPVVGDDEKVRAVGTKIVADMCRKILANEEAGIKGLHIYTLNLEKGAKMLLNELNLEGTREQVAPLPWRPALTPNRRSESIRPIFWANRAQSYLARTEDWDEFPNGRWGDSRSPAYGDLDGYPVHIGVSSAEAAKIWGTPEIFEDVASLFSRFVRGDLAKLPWSSKNLASESTIIDQQLAKMNKMGYLTINSQPAVDGVRSDDKVHGWGPAGGYVYQKAYLEFFVSPELLTPLIHRIEGDSRITYYAVNKQGDLRTNTHSQGPNAVTWGVFPGKEIVQPTIVEAVSFIAWKDEAFELGCQWATLYPEGSQSRKLIDDIMSTSYLVNIVANDFKDGMAVFQPFQLDKELNGSEPAADGIVNGVANGASGLVNGVKNALHLNGDH